MASVQCIILWTGTLGKKNKNVICENVRQNYKIINSLTKVDRDQLFIVLFKDIKSHERELVMVVPHTSGTRPVEILAKLTVNRSLYEFRGHVASTWKKYS